MPQSRVCTIIAGPNGAGKTTFAMTYLPKTTGTLNFINADLIAADLSPSDPSTAETEAARIFLRRIEEAISAGENFAFETTLSGRAHLRRIQRVRLEGWHVRLIYLYLPSVEMSMKRVAARVREGGHDIPKDAILRRYSKSLHNLIYFYEQECDDVICLNNTTRNETLIYEFNSSGYTVYDHAIYNEITQR